MLIISPSRIKIEKILAFAAKTGWILTAALCFFAAAAACVSFYLGRLAKEKEKAVSTAFRPQVLSLEKIGQGALSLRSNRPKTLLPDLSHEIALLTKNDRPDLKSKEVSFLFSLRSSKSEKLVKDGEIIFLACDSQAGGSSIYRFSEGKTPLWIKPSSLDRNQTLVEVGLFMPSKESEGFLEERAQFVLSEDSVKPKAFEGESWLSCLQKAKLWGPDALLPKLKDKQYASLAKKLKVEIPSSTGNVFCFMQQGDFLVWNGDAWEPSDEGERAVGKPLAQVKAVSSRGIELEVWNEDGFYPQEITWELRSPPRQASLKPDQLPQAVRARTAHQVSCRFGKRRYLLKPGDWILKTRRGWRVLKRSLDIEEYMLHKIRGELCIFEELIKEQGKLAMKGYWVDEMRTQMHLFSVPVEESRSAQKLSRKEKKEFVFKKTEGSVTTYLPFVPHEKAAGDSHE